MGCSYQWTRAAFQTHVSITLLQELLTWKIHSVGKVVLIMKYGEELVRDGEDFVLIFQQCGDNMHCFKCLSGVVVGSSKDIGGDDSGKVTKIHLATCL